MANPTEQVAVHNSITDGRTGPFYVINYVGTHAEIPSGVRIVVDKGQIPTADEHACLWPKEGSPYVELLVCASPPKDCIGLVHGGNAQFLFMARRGEKVVSFEASEIKEAHTVIGWLDEDGDGHKLHLNTEEAS